MGRMTYDGNVHADFDDRTLAHVQMVIANKLRRGEPFYFSWADDPSIGHGRTTVWIHPGSSLVFKFHGSRRPPLNRAWLEVLSRLANSPHGLRIAPEPQQVVEMETDEDGIVVP